MQAAESTNVQSRSVPIQGLWWKALVGPWLAVAIWMGLVVVGPAKGFTMEGHGAKVLIFHLPCAWTTTLAYLVAAYHAWKCLPLLKAGSPKAMVHDWKCAAAMELGTLFAILTTATGSMFSYNEWGAYWSWDPRQTSIVLLLMLMAAYLVLRSAVEDRERRARLSSVYALLSVVPGIFLLFVLPRIMQTLHEGANQAVIGGQLGGMYRPVIYFLALPAVFTLFGWILQLRVRTMRLIDGK